MNILLIGSEGYIGSILKEAISLTYHVDTCDILSNTSSASRYHYKQNYNNLTKDVLSEYRLIILLAANSSVTSCINDPEDAIQNNIVNFMKLLRKMNSNQTLIYASSGSVYDGYSDSNPNENVKIMQSRNIYDFTKIANDFMASTYEIPTIGLRFGTVSGFSPKMRNDLIINRMTADALNEKIITVSNSTAFRSCLGIKDLCSAVVAILDNLTNVKSNSSLYNLCSINHSIDEIANKISKVTNSKIIYGVDTPTYNFSMSTKKFEEEFNFTFKDTVETIVNNLITHSIN